MPRDQFASGSAHSGSSTEEPPVKLPKYRVEIGGALYTDLINHPYAVLVYLASDVEALLLQRAQEIAELQKDNAILRLANPIEEDLQLKIDEALKYLAMEQGFTLAGLARLLVECQRRLADDW